MSFTGDLPEAELGCRAWEIVGNGRSARDDGNEVFRLGIIRCVTGRVPCDDSASGEETTGRDIVIVAERVKDKKKS